MHGYTPADLANAFRTVRKNTLQVAEDIPDDKYDFVAAPGMMSVRDMLAHLVTSPTMYEDMHRVKKVKTLQGFDFGALRAKTEAEGKKLSTKASIVAALRMEGDKLASWLESLTPDFLSETFTDMSGANPKTRFESLLGVKEHEMHHRGQLMVMQRLMGVTPHLTRQREEMMRQRQASAAAK